MADGQSSFHQSVDGGEPSRTTDGEVASSNDHRAGQDVSLRKLGSILIALTNNAQALGSSPSALSSSTLPPSLPLVFYYRKPGKKRLSLGKRSERRFRRAKISGLGRVNLYDNILVFCVFHWYYIILCLFL